MVLSEQYKNAEVNSSKHSAWSSLIRVVSRLSLPLARNSEGGTSSSTYSASRNYSPSMVHASESFWARIQSRVLLSPDDQEQEEEGSPRTPHFSSVVRLLCSLAKCGGGGEGEKRGGGEKAKEEEEDGSVLFEPALEIARGVFREVLSMMKKRPPFDHRASSAPIASLDRLARCTYSLLTTFGTDALAIDSSSEEGDSELGELWSSFIGLIRMLMRSHQEGGSNIGDEEGSALENLIRSSASGDTHIYHLHPCIHHLGRAQSLVLLFVLQSP